ncbi:MAG: hypothetical protein JRE28_04890 [Deltaproteobacteria bacterium]|nr:hypothetical protein [Deltaproteobacteria bacterium]
MYLEHRLNVLKKIYGLYNDVAKNPDVACKKYCAACCTPDVTVTTLEGYLIANHMVSSGQADLFENIRVKISKNRFKPKITTNRLADLCMKGDHPGADLVPNLKIKVLMVPPEHRMKIKPFIDALLKL